MEMTAYIDRSWGSKGLEGGSCRNGGSLVTLA